MLGKPIAGQALASDGSSNSYVGIANGAATVLGVGAAAAKSTGAAAGHATVAATGQALGVGVGSSHGAATVTASGSAITQAIGDADGTSTVKGSRYPRFVPPSYRLISWEQMCAEADPDFWDDLRQPVQYEFTSGRAFYHPLPFYDDYHFRLDDPGQGDLDQGQLG